MLTWMIPLLLIQDDIPARFSDEEASVTKIGTVFTFRFTIEGGVFMKLNMWESEIKSFTDGRGNALGTHAVNESTAKSSAAIASLTGHDDQGALVTMYAKKQADGGPVRVEGFFDIWQAARVADGEERIRLEKDATFRIGEYDLVVDSIQDSKVDVILVTEKEIPREFTQELRFFDGETDLPRPGGNSQTSQEERDKKKVWVHRFTWSFKKRPENLILKYKVYVDPRRVKVPFKVSCDLKR